MPSLTAADTELIAAEVLGQNNRQIGSSLNPVFCFQGVGQAQTITQ